MPDPARNHAVVIGAGMAGLAAAQAISRHFGKVTLIERDVLSVEAAPRVGTPQCQHAHILLAGGCAMIQGLDETVSSRTQVSTMIANPFANMALSQRIKPRQLAADAPALLIACGLAMRRFDPA